jgi:hypothetical protein
LRAAGARTRVLKSYEYDFLRLYPASAIITVTESPQ